MPDQPTPTPHPPPASPPAPPPAPQPEADRFQRVMDIFLLAVDHDTAGRERVVQAQCGDDLALAEEVRAMLAAEPARDAKAADAPAASDSGQMLTGAGLRLGADAARAELRESQAEAAATLRTLPTIGGHYRILRTLGEGGMGVVYLAEQAVPRRMVALKAIRPGLASHSVLMRFVREANILGRLQHPGIAQIYECGVLEADESGRAFIVLEYVDGLPITRHVVDAGLSEQQRVLLLAEVCDAVHHAHLRGIIHRDLKPANILVERASPDQPPRPKVLDFGIARTIELASSEASAREPHDEQRDDKPDDGSRNDSRRTPAHDRIASPTLDGAIVGTPGYMSPEQLDGDAEAIDATSDVYALGVILYHTLAGRAPFDVTGRSLAEAARIIRTVAPAPLTMLSRARRADLQAIVAKAMHIDRARRYQSAAALADDLRALADRRPVAARRDSAMYVVSRLAARHRAIVVLALLLLAAGIAFAVSASVMAQRNARLATEADTARQAAESQRARVQTLNAQLEDELFNSRIDRGRAEAAAGRLRLAEDSLWPEHLARPDAITPRWALAELYQRVPLRWATRVASRSVSLSVIPTSQGPRIAIGRATGIIHIYDASGTALHVLTVAGASAASIAPLPGERMLVGLGDGRAAIIAIASGSTPTFLRLDAADAASTLLHARGIREVAASTDGRTLTLLGANNRLSVWRCDTPESSPRRIAELTPFPTSARSHALSPQGTLLLVAGDEQPYSKGGNYGGLRAYAIDGQTCTPLWSQARDVNAQVQRLAFVGERPNEQGTLVPTAIITRGDFCVGFIDAQTGRETTNPRPLDSTSFVFSGSPSTPHALISVADLVLALDLSTQAVTPLGQQELSVVAAGWLDDQTWVTLNQSGILRAGVTKVNPDTTTLDGFTNWCFSTCWSPDGASLAVSSGEGIVAIYSKGSTQRAATVRLPAPFRSRGLKWLSDNDTLVLGSQDGMVRLASASTGSVLRSFRATASEIYGMAIDPSERFVAVGQWNPAITVYDLASGQVVAELPKPERRVEGIAFSPDGRVMVTGGMHGHVQVWETSTWALSESIELSGAPWAVAFTPDGTSLLVSTYDGMIDAFDVDLAAAAGARFIKRGSIRAHQRLIPALGVSADGKLLATGSEDGVAKVWDTQTLRNLFSADLRAGAIVQVAFSPDGSKLSAASASRASSVIDLAAIFAPIDGQRALFNTETAKP